MTITYTGFKQREGDVKSFIFEPDEPVSWVAGQYTHLVLPHAEPDDRGDERWFTVSSAPSEGKVMISTRINAEHSSSFKHKLTELKPGDKIEVAAPEGDFVLAEPERNYIFVAGGIGITPYRSMLVELAAQGKMPRINLLYANKTEEIAFRQQLDSLQKLYPNLTIEYFVSPAKIDKAVLEARIKAMDNPLVYVSGPEPMVEAFAKDLAEMGLGEDNIKTDYFPGYEAF